jgi:hypothetical protein
MILTIYSIGSQGVRPRGLVNYIAIAVCPVKRTSHFRLAVSCSADTLKFEVNSLKLFQRPLTLLAQRSLQHPQSQLPCPGPTITDILGLFR